MKEILVNQNELGILIAFYLHKIKAFVKSFIFHNGTVYNFRNELIEIILINMESNTYMFWVVGLREYKYKYYKY